MPFNTSQESRIIDFCNRRHGKRTLRSRFRKLGEEFGELGEALANHEIAKEHNRHTPTNTYTTQKAMFGEIADMAATLIDMLGIEGASLSEELEKKLKIYEERLASGERQPEDEAK